MCSTLLEANLALWCTSLPLLDSPNKSTLLPPLLFLKCKWCGSCNNCCVCSTRGVEMSRKDRAELTLIQEGMTLELPKAEEKGKITFKYPVIKDPHQLKDNYGVAVKMATKLEDCLIRNDQLEDYNDQIQDYLHRNVIEPISVEEQDTWQKQGSPLNYISHRGVEKLTSASTKLRVVSNSSLKNNGTSYNDILPKGPNSLTPLIKALTTFRSYEHVVSWDLSKAYNTVYTG